MIKGLFELGGQQIDVIISGGELMFLDTSTRQITTIKGLSIKKSGVLKVFPDLVDNDNWKEIAIERLKDHIRKIESEDDKIYYIKKELEKYGYKGLYYQKGGWRPQKFKL